MSFPFRSHVLDCIVYFFRRDYLRHGGVLESFKGYRSVLAGNFAVWNKRQILFF